MAQHIVPRSTYLLIFAILILLTLLTVAVSFVEMGRLHVGVALLIASAKATLVVLFFMHVLYSSRLVWLAIGLAIFCLGILIGQTFSDYLTRHWLPRSTPAEQLTIPAFPRP